MCKIVLILSLWRMMLQCYIDGHHDTIMLHIDQPFAFEDLSQITISISKGQNMCEKKIFKLQFMSIARMCQSKFCSQEFKSLHCFAVMKI